MPARVRRSLLVNLRLFRAQRSQRALPALIGEPTLGICSTKQKIYYNERRGRDLNPRRLLCRSPLAGECFEPLGPPLLVAPEGFKPSFPTMG